MALNRNSLIFTIGALCLGAVALAPPAEAQSCDREVTAHSSFPANGATNVATNAPVYIYGPGLNADNTEITAQDAAGEDVGLTSMTIEGGLLIDAFLGFAPRTRYELTVSPQGGEPWSTAFTTGAGPTVPGVGLQQAAPDVDVSVIEQGSGTCLSSAVCVNGEISDRVSVEIVVGNEVMSVSGGTLRPGFLAQGEKVGGSACINVRVRDPGGYVSNSTRVCGSDIARYELAETAAVPQSCQAFRAADDDDTEGSSESGGCNMVASGAAPGAAGLLLGLCALFAARQRRRVR